MPKKLLRILILIVVPLSILTICVLLLNENLDEKISANYQNSIGHTYGLAARDNGVSLLRHSAQKGDIILMGSSELGVKTDNSPINRFPNSTAPYDITLTGRAKVQSLENAIKLGAIASSVKDNRVALVVSLQWFTSKDIDKQSLLANFSELQFYETMNNPAISSKTKQSIRNRLSRFISGNSSFEQANAYTELSSQNGIVQKSVFTVLSPYYMLYNNYLNLKDKWNAVKTLPSNNVKPVIKLQQTAWPVLEQQATQQGKTACTNNDFYVKDDYYNANLATRIDKLKNSMASIDCQSSAEWGDLESFFEVCQQTNVKPYIVIMSTNGKYYDYTGLSREKRLAVYNRIEEMAKAHGCSVLNLKDKEYEPYFYQDVMHLGWKGWLYVDEQITKHFS